MEPSETSSTPLALVFTDMVGSSVAKRSASLGENVSARDEAYLSAIQTRHLRLVRECVSTHGGKEIMTIGDSFFLTFEEARAALLCSAEIQMQLKAQPIMTETGPVKLRIGIHCGMPKFFENSWHGTDVDTAARAESAGSPDQIILTEAARLQLGPLPGIPLHRLGTFALKGVGDVALWDVDYDQHGPRSPQLLSIEQVHRNARVSLFKKAATATLAVALVVAAFLVYRHSLGVHNLTKDPIILADVANKTGDTVFDTTLTQAIAIQLEQSPVLSLVSQEHIQQSLQYIGKPTDTALTPELARLIGEREGIKAYLAGSITKIGSGYLITLSAQSTKTGDDIASEQAQAVDKDHVLEAVGKVATQMRAQLGESMNSIQKLDTPIDEATTSSLEAFQAYALGDVEHEKGLDIPQAESHFRQAIELDPKFAMAWARLGVIYGNSSQHSKAVDAYTHAYELSKNASERERLYIEGHFYQTVTGDLGKVVETLELATRTYPLTNDNWVNLGNAQLALGRLEDTLATNLKAVEVDPSDAISRTNLLGAYVTMDRPKEAAETEATTLRLHMDVGTDSLVSLYQFYFFSGNTRAMARVVGQADGRPDQFFLTSTVAFTQEFGGNYHRAAATWDQSMHQAAAQKAPDTQASYLLYRTSGRALAGTCEDAPAQVRAALALDKSKATLTQAVYAAALCDDRADSDPLLTTLAKDYPEDTIIQQVTIPQSRAAMDIAEHKPAIALQELEGSKSFDLVSDGPYLRGLAYLQLHDATNAIEAFQSATKYKGACLNLLQDYGQGRLGLARAYVLAGNKPTAKLTYEDLFTLWKNADPDLPQLLAARKEYAALQ